MEGTHQLLQQIISIHTPTQGVTLTATSYNVFNTDFNPHSHAGSDHNSPSPLCISHNFNPHSHAGSDNFRVLIHEIHYPISIHTPTQGVTGKEGKEAEAYYNFNPHSHAGSDGEPIKGDEYYL